MEQSFLRSVYLRENDYQKVKKYLPVYLSGFKKRWMDSELMKRYVDYLKEKVGSRSRSPMLMVYDSFRGHLKESVKKKFRDHGFDLAVIPGGLTALCQPLDVAIN